MGDRMNKVILKGHVGGVYELRDAGESKVINFSIATKRNVKRGETWEPVTTWHRLVAWNKKAELVQNYVTKGKELLIVGHMEYDEYENKEGQKVKTADVVVDEIEFCGKKETTEQVASPPELLEDQIPF